MVSPGQNQTLGFGGVPSTNTFQNGTNILMLISCGPIFCCCLTLEKPDQRHGFLIEEVLGKISCLTWAYEVFACLRDLQVSRKQINIKMRELLTNTSILMQRLMKANRD